MLRLYIGLVIKVNRYKTTKSSQGFTLIELLITIVIVGILSAIALPSFLNSVSKSRGAEAKTNLGTINRAQQTYLHENQRFAPDLATLSTLGMAVVGQHYTYSVSGATNSATADADPLKDDQKDYAAGLIQEDDGKVLQVICESLKVKGAASDNTAVASLSVGPPASASCSSGARVQ
jgi:type IV pilus assembly protein PilA